ncbi:MAG: hypothetical protein EOO81_12645 [Oxalobacteraceae bacterium]|nr:MAG: hypothetical protein EOO81_12645 [Oxalobacteraceae bacterium]
MASDLEVEIYKQQRLGQDKYIYFLLAAVGASIAFSLNQTKGLPLSPTQWPLGLAVVCWAGSFLMGCSRLGIIDLTLNANQGLVRVQKGTHELLEHPAEIPIASKVMIGQLETLNTKASRRARWQYRLLIVGAVFYIGWHVYEMYLRAL